MIKKYSDKKKVYISLILIFLLMTLIGGTYAIITKTITSSKKQVITAGVLSLSLDEEEEINITDAYPMYDEVGMIQEPFTFSLTNTGGDAVDYTLVMEEIIVEQTEHKCSSLGEITIDSPEECRKIDYSSELRQEALTMCQAWFSDIVTENDCLVAMKNDGAPYTKFEDFIEEGIYYGQFEDKRVVTETYPDNYILYEFPKISKYNVKYGLTKDGTSTINYMDENVLDNGSLLLDVGVIDVGQTIEYEFRMWIDSFVDDEEDVAGKSLKFKVNVLAGQVGVPNSIDDFTYVLSDYVVKDYNACAEYLVEKGISTDYDTAILNDCQSITQGNETIQNAYPVQFQEMIENGVVKEEYGATITSYENNVLSLVIPSTILVDGSMLNRNDVSKISVPVVALSQYVVDPDVVGTNLNNKKYSLTPLAAVIRTKLNNLVIPDTVLYVGNSFFNETASYSVQYSSNLQVIGDHAFGAIYLSDDGEELILPTTVTYVGVEAFTNNKLNSVELPEGLLRIKNSAFMYNNFVTVTIPSSVIEIGNKAFYNGYYNYELSKVVNKTGRPFNWYKICVDFLDREAFVTGQISITHNNNVTQTIEVVAE